MLRDRTDTAKDQAHGKLESITQMLQALSQAETDTARDDAEQEILDSALDAGIERMYYILLCWGGPAVRIVGELNHYNEPWTARLQYLDWGTPWLDYPLRTAEADRLLDYAKHYSFE